MPKSRLVDGVVTPTALRTIRLEIDGLAALEASLGTYRETMSFLRAINTLIHASRVIVTGMGKSGHVGQKVAATLSSTGTPAYFIHPADAGHGDLGMILKGDAVLAFSWSGETTELGPIVHYTRRFAVPLIAVTSDEQSALGKAADVVLVLPEVEEACPFGLAPTTSTIMELALGDALALALLKARGFTLEDYKDLHPGGKLGAKLRYVSDLMHTCDEIPAVYQDTSVGEAILIMTELAFGCVGVMSNDTLVGIVTDGDLRRHLDDKALLLRPVASIMTHNPKTISPDTLAVTALEIMNSSEITALFVVADDGQPVGIVHVHDLLRAGVL